MGIGIGDWGLVIRDWDGDRGLRIGIGDWRSELNIGILIGIGDWDWRLGSGIRMRSRVMFSDQFSKAASHQVDV